MNFEEIPLVKVYGENVIDEALIEINELKANSNIPFDKEYVNLGIAFMNIKSQQILDGEKKKCNLKSLVSESFGESAIAMFNR